MVMRKWFQYTRNAFECEYLKSLYYLSRKFTKLFGVILLSCVIAEMQCFYKEKLSRR